MQRLSVIYGPERLYRTLKILINVRFRRFVHFWWREILPGEAALGRKHAKPRNCIAHRVALFGRTARCHSRDRPDPGAGRRTQSVTLADRDRGWLCHQMVTVPSPEGEEMDNLR